MPSALSHSGFENFIILILSLSTYLFILVYKLLKKVQMNKEDLFDEVSFKA